jgi:hypothetical protein
VEDQEVQQQELQVQAVLFQVLAQLGLSEEQLVME